MYDVFASALDFLSRCMDSDIKRIYEHFRTQHLPACPVKKRETNITMQFSLSSFYKGVATTLLKVNCKIVSKLKIIWSTCSMTTCYYEEPCTMYITVIIIIIIIIIIIVLYRLA